MSEIVNSSLKTAVKGTTLVFLGTVASTILWFATKILIVRNTTKEELGIYSLAIAVVGIFSLIAGAGLQNGVTRYISIFLGKNKENDAKAVSKASIQIATLAGITASLLLYIFAAPIAQHVFYMPEFTLPLKVISMFVFFEVVSKVLIGVMRGYGIIKPMVYYINIGQPLFFLIFLIVCFSIKLPFISVLYAFVFSMLLVMISIGTYGHKKVGFSPFALRGGKFKMELLRFSVPLLGVAVMGIVFTRTDTLMLGRYATAEDVGVYNVSISLVRLLTFVLGAAAFVFMPVAGDMYAKKQLPELKRTYQILTKWVFSATLPLFFVMFFFPEMIITFLFGERYIDSSIPLRILSLGFMVYVFVGTNTMMLTVLGMSKKLMNVSIFGTVLNILLNYILIKRLGFGIIGASVATAASYATVSFINAYVLYRHSKIHPITLGYIKPIIGSAVIGLIIYGVVKTLPFFYFWMLPLYFMLFLIGYFVSLLLTRSLDREDIAMFEAISEKTGLEMKFIRKLIYRFAHN
jgi:O-antigen/teichoic acid export membrane protein